jgi:hypothetical protein
VGWYRWQVLKRLVERCFERLVIEDLCVVVVGFAGLGERVNDKVNRCLELSVMAIDAL